MSSFTIVYYSGDFAEDICIGNMGNTQVTYGINTRTSKCIFKKEGFQFVGWKAHRVSDDKWCYVNTVDKKRRFFRNNEHPIGWEEHIYKDEAIVSRLSLVDNDVIEFIAQWEIISLDVESNKKTIEKRLLTRPVVLFGGKKECEEFYLKYSDRLNIRCVLLDEEIENARLNWLCDTKPFQVKRLKENDFVIICQKARIRLDDKYKKAKNSLVKAGLQISKDFIRADVAEVILDHKKLWLWFGYCQIETLRSDVFEKIKSVNKEYVLTSFRFGLDTMKKSYKFSDCTELLKICDCITYMPLIFAEGKIDFDFEASIPLNTRRVTLPRMPFPAYYPYRETNMEEFHVSSRKLDGKLHWPFAYSEKSIDDLILMGKTDDEIYAELMKDDFIPEKEIIKKLKYTYKIIEISEAKADIKMLDFIKENLTKRMMYRDGLHYQNFLYFEIARRISKHLQLNCEEEINSLENEIKDNGKQYIDYTEVPILPCVANALHLSFIDDKTLYRVRFTEGGVWRGTQATIREMTRKEWIYSYIDYTRACLTLNHFWNV